MPESDFKIGFQDGITNWINFTQVVFILFTSSGVASHSPWIHIDFILQRVAEDVLENYGC
jgi:hypothetical protein